MSDDPNRQSTGQRFCVNPVSILDTTIPEDTNPNTGKPVFDDLYHEDGSVPTYRETARRGVNGSVGTLIHLPANEGDALPADPTHAVASMNYRDEFEASTMRDRYPGLPQWVEDRLIIANNQVPCCEVSLSEAQWLARFIPSDGD